MHYFANHEYLSIFTLFVWIQKGNTESPYDKKRRENGGKRAKYPKDKLKKYGKGAFVNL